MSHIPSVEPAPPVFADDHGDLMIFESVDRMASEIEVFDVGEFEFFDARGGSLRATIEGYRMATFGPVPDVPANPERLKDLLHGYFSRLPQRYERYSERGAQSRSLDELVKLRWEVENRPRRSFLRRIWGKAT